MPYQTANIYKFTVFLGSKIKTNAHRGEYSLVAAQSPGAAINVLQNYYGNDLVNFVGPILAEQNVLTTMTGS